MANMGRCGAHGCAFSVRLVNGAREEYCPECALATAQAERDATREQRDAYRREGDAAIAERDAARQRAEQAEAALAWVRDQLRQGRTISATYLETPTLIMEADGSVTGNLTVATRPPALPPLPSSTRVHVLKTDPDVFGALALGAKTYEIRKDDRGFAVGDGLDLRETESSGAQMATGAPLVYTGRRVLAAVTHILRGPVYGLADGWVVLSIRHAEAAHQRLQQAGE